MKKEDFILDLINDDGTATEYDILSITADVETDNTYVVYTDYTLLDNDDFKLYVSKLVEDDGNYSLEDVDKDEYDNIPNLKVAVDAANDQINVIDEEEGE